MNIFNELVVEPDLEWEFIDGSIVKSHQYSSGAAFGQESAIGNQLLEIQLKSIWQSILVVFQFISE